MNYFQRNSTSNTELQKLDLILIDEKTGGIWEVFAKITFDPWTRAIVRYELQTKPIEPLVQEPLQKSLDVSVEGLWRRLMKARKFNRSTNRRRSGISDTDGGPKWIM